jgi:hypothetical protein
MKKVFLIVKLAKQIGSALTFIPVPGLFDRPSAEELVNELKDRDPGSIFLIQEVGTA